VSKFKGYSEEDIPRWLAHYERITSASSLDPAVIFPHYAIPAVLERLDQAGIMFTKGAWPTLKSALVDLYQERENKEHIMDELSSRTQRSSESVREFAAVVSDLSLKVGQDPNFAITYFRRGLKSEIRSKLISYKYDTFKSCVRDGVSG
jgi:hypothetical protein